LARAGASLWSGLARGVDGIVHSACVAAGVPTIAVLAGGLDAIYPAEHAPLADRIVATGGALLSELPPGQRARRGHFVRRNRILALATDHVVVVEASLTSGALHTARFAAEAGPEVYALPGPWHSERSQGCHRLLAEGAHVIESTDGLLQALGLGTGSAAVSHHLARSADEERVLQAAAGGPRPTDLLARECGLERGAFLRALFRLEQQGTLQRLPGDLWRRLHGSDAAAAAPTNR
jgi:DNA processing protein